MINNSIRCFWSFIFFIPVSQNKCHKQKWRVLFFMRNKLVARVLACFRAISSIKWKRLRCINYFRLPDFYFRFKKIISFMVIGRSIASGYTLYWELLFRFIESLWEPDMTIGNNIKWVNIDSFFVMNSLNDRLL